VVAWVEQLKEDGIEGDVQGSNGEGNTTHRSWTVYRRYSDFWNLRKKLLAATRE
jgi:hypothetical protein